MKKTYKYAVVGLLFLFLAGCEDFLDKREDSGGLTEEAVYSSYESIRDFWIKYILNWKPITHLKVQMMERINARM